MDDKQLVVKSNRLIEASYRLSLNEQRVILLAISRVRRDRPLQADDMFEVHASDLVQFFGVDPKTAYGELMDVAKTLFHRHVTLDNPFPDDPRIKTLLTRWISSIAYLPEYGCIQLRFAQDVLPFLSVLEVQFTRYTLEAVGKMTSVYAVRMYELLVQWGDVGKREISIDWLKKQFQIEDKYEAIKDFKARIIEPGIMQINAYTDLHVSYTQRKTGRSITHLTFSFEPKKTARPKRLPAGAGQGEKIMGVLKADIERLARAGESYEQAAERIRRMRLIQ